MLKLNGGTTVRNNINIGDEFGYGGGISSYSGIISNNRVNISAVACSGGGIYVVGIKML